jgi:hypothetical protein
MGKQICCERDKMGGFGMDSSGSRKEKSGERFRECVRNSLTSATAIGLLRIILLHGVSRLVGWLVSATREVPRFLDPSQSF